LGAKEKRKLGGTCGKSGSLSGFGREQASGAPAKQELGGARGKIFGGTKRNKVEQLKWPKVFGSWD
jgi:hypothetical protein